LSKKNKAGSITLPVLKMHYVAIATETTWLQHGNTHRPMEQNREPRSKNTYWGEDNLFNKWYWGNWVSTRERLELDSSLPVTRINSKWTK
jgi:acyl-coenzyme A synthetase/AMP-(fatty) acid ligase